jgi:hypothetical protein
MAFNSPVQVPVGGGQVHEFHSGMNPKQGKDKPTAVGWGASTQQTNNLAKQNSVLAGLRRNSMPAVRQAHQSHWRERAVR